MSIKISIVVPVYNVEKYLRTCLNSIVNQTLKDIEIICVDDGSTDNSPLILAEYAIKDSRIKVITKQNFGYGNTMNIGISHAQGEYLGIVESDDYIDEYMYEILYKTAKQNDLDIAKSLFTSFDNDSLNVCTLARLVQTNQPLIPSQKSIPSAFQFRWWSLTQLSWTRPVPRPLM